MKIFFARGFAAAAIVSSFVLVGCGKSPEKVCAQLEELNKDSKEKDKKKEDCVKEVAEIKEKAPKGFDCISKALDEHKDRKAFYEALDKCGKEDENLKKVFKEQSERRSAEREKKEAEQIAGWPKLKEKEFSSALGDAKFKITLAEGWKEEAGGGEFMKSFKYEPEDVIVGPSIRITKGSDDLEQAAKNKETIMKHKVTKKEKTDAGWVIHAESEDSVHVEVQVKVGDKDMQCEGSFYGKAGVEKKGDLIPWFEKMCKSLAAG